MKIDLVKIKYQDICSNSEKWRDYGESLDWFLEEKEGIIFTVGWLLEKNKTSVLLAGSWDKEENEFNDLTKIPLSCIKEVKKL